MKTYILFKGHEHLPSGSQNYLLYMKYQQVMINYKQLRESSPNSTTFKTLISLMISSSFPVICQLIFNEIKDRLKMEADHSKGILNNIILSLLKIRGETKS